MGDALWACAWLRQIAMRARPPLGFATGTTVHTFLVSYSSRVVVAVPSDLAYMVCVSLIKSISCVSCHYTRLKRRKFHFKHAGAAARHVLCVSILGISLFGPLSTIGPSRANKYDGV